MLLIKGVLHFSVKLHKPEIAGVLMIWWTLFSVSALLLYHTVMQYVSSKGSPAAFNPACSSRALRKWSHCCAYVVTAEVYSQSRIGQRRWRYPGIRGLEPSPYSCNWCSERPGFRCSSWSQRWFLFSSVWGCLLNFRLTLSGFLLFSGRLIPFCWWVQWPWCHLKFDDGVTRMAWVAVMGVKANSSGFSTQPSEGDLWESLWKCFFQVGSSLIHSG